MSKVAADAPDPTGQADGAILDRSCLTDLADQLASPQAAAEFAAVFVEMLPGRVEAIEAPLADTRVQAARTAALSLGSSAAMVGARQLVRDAGLINQHLKTGSLEAARDVAARLSADAAAVSAAIEEMLAGQ
ncbi:Hpt domain-containing protein [Pseudarthrobacter chlorophenolicus]|uniref:Hpt domain-containing protein n=1 Tax=Pseudarthrobacter chlorophenolicus TaxID=85085 RepID=UPI0005F2F811|nr:Hpt domain-containing protein [Pseudarthrobacter chlorophenolicus]